MLKRSRCPLRRASAAAALGFLALCAVPHAAEAGGAQGASQPAPNQLTAAEARDGWVLLFDGKSTRGWQGFKMADMTGLRWAVRDDCLCSPPSEGAHAKGRRDIVTDRLFTDFDLTWDWKIDPGGNSGVKYFIIDERRDAVGHEYQLLDDDVHPDGKNGPNRLTAGFYDVLAPVGARPKPAGRFNHSRILVKGAHVEHWLNGTKVVDYELGSPALAAAVAKSKFKDVAGFGTKVAGRILLQDHGDGVCFQNVKIRELK